MHCEEEKVNLCVSTIKTSDTKSFIGIFFIKPIRIMGEEEAERLMGTQPSFSELLHCFHGHDTSDFQMCASSYSRPFKLTAGMA